MISQDLTKWFQEEVKKEMADVIENRDAATMAISLLDENGIVWMEGFKHTQLKPLNEESEYLIHYSVHREEAFNEDFPFSISITIIE